LKEIPKQGQKGEQMLLEKSSVWILGLNFPNISMLLLFLGWMFFIIFLLAPPADLDDKLGYRRRSNNEKVVLGFLSIGLMSISYLFALFLTFLDYFFVHYV
jgi:hypothetical protein